MEYTVYYEIPYIGFDVFYKNKNCNFSYGMDFSNYVRAYDRDDHLLRDKISYSEAEGNYYYVDSNFQYIIKKNIRLNTSLSYLFIETLGLQKQYKYGGKTKEFIGSVITRIESEQSSLSLGIEIDF